MLLFLLFVIVPIVEITLFVELGGLLGLGPTLLIVLATAVVGSIALRRQGRTMIQRLSRPQLLGVPDLLSEGLLLFAAGILLITPGFLTDVCGLLLLFPPIRSYIARAALRNAAIHVATASSGPDRPTSGPNTREPRSDPFPRETARPSQPRDASPWRDAEDATVLDESNSPKRSNTS